MQRIALYLGILLTLTVNLSACGEDPDVQAIRTSIKIMSVAAENHDASGIVQYIDESYRGVGGTRSGVTDLLQNHFNINKNINLIISDIEILLAEDRQTAKVRVRVLMTGGEGNLPERGRLSAIRSKWKKINNEWKVIDAVWKPVLLQV